MPTSAFLNTATKRPRAGRVFALIAFVCLAVLSGCAEAGDMEPGHDAPSTTGSTPAANEADSAGPNDSTGSDAASESTVPGRDSGSEEPREDTEQGRAGGSTPGTAQAMLDDLTVKGRAPKTGYDADLFKWRSDADHNGCDTRNDILRRDLRNITLKAGTKGCVVIAGDLDDEYKGETYAFDRSPNNIDIDHIVARSNAWQTGAARFDEETLKKFGNDPLNLLAVSSSLNRQKGDGDAATWLPPAKSYRCEYVARQIAIKAKYDLWVVKAEKTAMTAVLDGCENQPAFSDDVAWPEPGDGDNVTTAKDKPARSSAKSSAKKSHSGSGSSSSESKPSGAGSKSVGSGSVHFKNCTAARDAGAAPVYRGDPGYAPHLDRDGDGVGCE